MAKDLFQAGSGACEDPGRGMLEWQAHFWSPVNQLDHSIPSWEMKMPACVYMATLWPISVQHNFLLWSIKSALCEGTPTDRISPLKGTLKNPTVQTTSPLGAHNGPSQDRALTNIFWGKTNLFNIDIAFSQQTLPYIFLRITIMSPRLWNQIWEIWLNNSSLHGTGSRGRGSSLAIQAQTDILCSAPSISAFVRSSHRFWVPTRHQSLH